MPSLKFACSPTPLQQYLKALGIFRITSEQVDPEVTAWWVGDTFHLQTHLSQVDVERFWLTQYRPSPILTPWNGGSGFYGNSSNQRFINKIAQSTSDRLAPYTEAVLAARQVLQDLNIESKPPSEGKHGLVMRLRNWLPDEALKWLDCSIQLTGDSLGFPPLVGSGGNDGNLDFSKLFQEALDTVVDLSSGTPHKDAAALLQSALWGVIAPKRKISIKSGQFSPLDGGNVNASSDGYTAGERANPWDLILATEGCLLFYSTAARRHGVTEPGELTCPFTVRSSALGYASAAPEGCRAESWLPLWSTPSGLLQLKALFREGRYRVRSGVSDRPARDGLDFARAISTLGEKRKIDQFIRYGFLERNGKAHYAVPLGRFQPKYDPQVNCLAEIDAWVNRLRSSSRGENVPLSIKSALRQLEMSLFDLTQGKATLLDVLIALGKTERDLARSPNFVKEHFIDPVPLLQTWIENVRNAQQDIRVNSAEFRLALSLAGTGIRQRIVPVKPGRYPKWDFENPATVWSNASLSVNLVRSLRRKTIEAEQKREAVKPAYPPFATLSDISDWIFGSADPSNIEAMAHGLSLCNLYGQQIAPQLGAIPIAYSLPAICHHWCSLYRSTSRQEGQEKLPKWVEQADLSIPYTYGIPYVSGMFNRLAAGDSQTATTLAIRRLRASGINPITSEGITSEGLWGLADQPLRIAAALAFPIGDVVWKTHEDGRKVLSGGVKFLIDQVQIKEKKKDESV